MSLRCTCPASFSVKLGVGVRISWSVLLISQRLHISNSERQRSGRELSLTPPKVLALCQWEALFCPSIHHTRITTQEGYTGLPWRPSFSTSDRPVVTPRPASTRDSQSNSHSDTRSS